MLVGDIWGSGRRSGLLSSLVVAVRSESGEYLTAGKVGAGFSDEKLEELTEALESKNIRAEGCRAEIEPSRVIEVDFQDIQATDAYEAGYALHIPRFQNERPDKSPAEADSLDRLRQLLRPAFLSVCRSRGPL